MISWDALGLYFGAEPLLYGMLVGTGIGGNISPVGATANVLARGMLDKNGVRVEIGPCLSIGVPLTVAAVVTAQILIVLVRV